MPRSGDPGRFCGPSGTNDFAMPAPKRILGSMAFDQAVLRFIAEHRTGWADSFSRGLMDAGQPAATYVSAAVALLICAWVFHAWRAAIAAMLASFTATIVAEGSKDLIGRPRPPLDLALISHGGGYAFPSSIGALTAGAAAPLVLFAWRTGTRTGRAVAGLLTAGTILVGICMVYLGAHWVTDVLAGWALGAAIGVGMWLVADRVLRRPRVSAA
jgi:membrane-associated phospholipid phosphatase